MHEVADALATVLQHARRLPTIEARLGRRSSAKFSPRRCARMSIRPFAKSLRDGYAVRAADCASVAPNCGSWRKFRPGHAASSISAGECARISPCSDPSGADAVVMQEQCESLPDRRIACGMHAPRREYVYSLGAEMKAGEVVLPSGTTLSPAALGLLAGVGRERPRSCPAAGFRPRHRRRTRRTGRGPWPGQIRNTNGPLLTALAAAAGAVPTTSASQSTTRFRSGP